VAEITIVVHGGAGRGRGRVARPEKVRAALEAALAAGHELLAGGGSALDAVEEAVRSLEDEPLLNAGRGSVLTAAGDVQMDAALMCGASGEAGAVAAVRRVRNPISLARAVLEDERHVLLVGAGAEEFARERGYELWPEWQLITRRQRRRWQRLYGQEDEGGTVGAVALDANGNVAAAASTGGVPRQRPGRVGDSAIPGAGVWAENATCAASLTGAGDAIIRAVAGHELAALIAHRGCALQQAADEVIQRRLAAASAGLIALDRAGNVALAANCRRMYRAIRRGDSSPRTALLTEEPLI
jgi:L-asparaginase / beta-aspartyl-peptidase